VSYAKAVKQPVKLIHPFSFITSGPSGCGKTEFVKFLLYNKDKMIRTENDKKVKRVEWYYGVRQKRLEDQLKEIVPNIVFREGLPKEKDITSNIHPKIMIIDDLMHETEGDVVGSLFTKGSHHNNISVIYISQNLFPNIGKAKGEMRNMSLNTIV
jgi:ABC-type phosphate transport system ATPase subunit